MELFLKRLSADFLLFVDRLFDSFNGSTIEPPLGKIFRGALKDSSPHIKFWVEAKAVLQSIKFVKNNKTSTVPPTVKNWIKTIDNKIELWKYLKQLNFKFLITRNLNQDALENFFGCIRSHGVRNTNPTCTSFEASFKTFIVNNFVSPHARANCEEDESTEALDCLKNFINVESDEIEGIAPLPQLEEDDFNFRTDLSILTFQLESYMTGYLCKKIFKCVGVCSECRKITSNNIWHQTIFTFKIK
jgi:hypothetical protein